MTPFLLTSLNKLGKYLFINLFFLQLGDSILGHPSYSHPTLRPNPTHHFSHLSFISLSPIKFIFTASFIHSTYIKYFFCFSIFCYTIYTHTYISFVSIKSFTKIFKSLLLYLIYYFFTSFLAILDLSIFS